MLVFATFAIISFAVSRHLLNVILILPGGTGGSAVIIRAEKFKIILFAGNFVETVYL